MKLSVLERLMALGLIPKEGDITLLRLRLGMIQKIGLSAEELEEYEVQANPNGQGVTWRSDLPQDQEIDLTDAEIGVLRNALHTANQKRSLHVDHMSLYEKIVEGAA